MGFSFGVIDLIRNKNLIHEGHEDTRIFMTLYEMGLLAVFIRALRVPSWIKLLLRRMPNVLLTTEHFRLLVVAFILR